MNPKKNQQSLEDIAEETITPEQVQEKVLSDKAGMRISLCWYGGAEEVPGSKIKVKIRYADGIEKHVGVDMGSKFIQKGSSQSVDSSVPDDYNQLDSLLFTHAHADHVGATRDLVMRHNYRGPIFMTHPTKSLCQANQFAFVEPGESYADHKAFLKLFETMGKTHGYRKEIDVLDDGSVTAEFWNAGHMIGSASILLTITDPENGEDYKLFFSGDVGRSENWEHYLEPPWDLSELPEVDAVIVEGTYGNELHRELHVDGKLLKTEDCLEHIIEHSVETGAPIFFAGFSLRLDKHYLDAHRLKAENRIPEWYPFILDSPSAEGAIAKKNKYLRVALDRKYAEKTHEKHKMNISVDEFQEMCRQYIHEGTLELFLDEEGNYHPRDNPFYHDNLRRTSRPEHDTLSDIVGAAYTDGVLEGNINPKAKALVKWLDKLYATVEGDERESLTRIATPDGEHYVGPMCIGCSSGMISLGRASDWALEFLANEDAIFVISGYQAPGTAGHQMWEQRASRENKDLWKEEGMDPRTIWSYEDRDPDASITFYVDGKKETLPFKAKIYRLTGHSGHGDGLEMIDWLGDIRFREDRGPRTVLLNHIDDSRMDERSDTLEEVGYHVIIPEPEKDIYITNLLSVHPEKKKKK